MKWEDIQVGNVGWVGLHVSRDPLMKWSNLKVGSVVMNIQKGIFLVVHKTSRNKHTQFDWFRLDTGEYLPADPNIPETLTLDDDDTIGITWDVL